MLKRILAIVLLAGAALFILSSSSISSSELKCLYPSELKETDIADGIETGINVEVISYSYSTLEKHVIEELYEIGKDIPPEYLSLKLSIENNTNKSYALPKASRLEYKGTDGEWYVISEAGWEHSIEHRLPGNTVIEYDLPVSDGLDEKLDKGEYRAVFFVRTISNEDSSYYLERYAGPDFYFTAEFEVK